MHLLLVGAITTAEEGQADSYGRELRRLVADLKLEDRVRFLGVRKDVGDLLSASDVFAFPSRAEALGLALLEAMAAGLPCVASSVGGITDIVTDGDNGLLVQTENVGTWADNLVKLARDERLRSRMAERAVASLGKFSSDYQASRILELYEDLLARCGRHLPDSRPAGVAERKSVAACGERQA
jgi:glycosyltransferase involved in cell wall biosynthesis